MAKIFGNFISVTYEWEVYIRVVILKTQRRKQTDSRTEKKEKKGSEETSEKGEELEGKAKHYCKEGGLSAATSVVSVIVCLRKLIY